MKREKTIDRLVALVSRLNAYLSNPSTWKELDAASAQAMEDNPFFTPFMQRKAISSICSQFLDNDALQQFSGKYEFDALCEKAVGIVMAGNIPLVGFHDLICVLLSGARPVIKLSSKDNKILPVLFPDLNYVSAAEFDKTHLDALITMGGDVAAAHFKTAFPSIPSLIRSSRFSVAVLPQEEISDEQKQALFEDIYLYYGLGCRSVTHLLVPESFDIERFAHELSVACNDLVIPVMQSLLSRNKAVLSIDNIKFTDAGLFLITETDDSFLPIGLIGCHRYSNREIDEHPFLHKNLNDIQKIYRNFGIAQRPSLRDFPDDKDTMLFLSDL